MTAHSITRRDALRKMGGGVLLSLGLWPGALHLKARGSDEGAFKFIAVNDTHYMSPDCGRWLELVTAQMKTEGAEFCLHCGDVTEKGERENLGAARDVFQRLGIPTYFQIGNHDYTTQTDRRAYEDLFPKRLNYVFEHRGWQFIGLDTTEGQRYEKTSIQQPTLNWLDEHLPRLDSRKPTVIFTHFPLGEVVKYRPDNADDLLERFKAFNLKGAFSGHGHGYTLRWQGPAFAVTNRCCALKRNNHDKSPPKGYFVCEVRDEILTYRFVEVKMPKELQAVAGETKKPAPQSGSGKTRSGAPAKAKAPQKPAK